jgi:hypothetical protein
MRNEESQKDGKFFLLVSDRDDGFSFIINIFDLGK